MSSVTLPTIRRSVNWPFLLGTVVAGGLVLGGLYFVYRWQITRTAKGLIELAARQEEASNWSKAAEYLDRYLRIRGEDGDARVRLASAYAHTAVSAGQKKQAIELHYRALASAKGQSEIAVRSKLAELLAQTGQFIEAEREARKLLETAPESAEAQRLLAIAITSQLTDGSLVANQLASVKVLDIVERGRESNPDDVTLARIQAGLLRDYPQLVEAEHPTWTDVRRIGEADQCLDDLIGRNSQSAHLYLARYEYRRKYGLAGADADLEMAVSIAPDDSQVILLAASDALRKASVILQAGGATDESQALLLQAKHFYEQLARRSSGEQVPEVFLGLGEVCSRLDKTDEALAAWRTGVKQFARPTTQVAFHSRIAETCLQTERLSEAAESLNAIDATLGKLGASVSTDERRVLTRDLDLLRATWHLQRREFAAAIPLLRQVAVNQPKGGQGGQSVARAWILLGSALTSLGEWLDAATAYDQASAIYPSYRATRISASNCWLNAGRPDLANERAEQVIAISSGSSAEGWMALAVAQLQLQISRPVQQRSWRRFEEALDVLEKSKDTLATGAPWLVDFLRVDYTIAESKALNDAAGGMAVAAKTLQRAEQDFSDKSEFWQQLCFVYENLGLAAEADRAFQAFCDREQDLGKTSLAKARLLGLRGDFAQASKALLEAAKAVPIQSQKELRAELLKVFVSGKDYKSARGLLMEDLRLSPRNTAVIRKLAELDLQARDLPAVEKWEISLRQAGPYGEPIARYFHAWRMYLATESNQGVELNTALRDLEQVILARPNWVEAATLKAMTEQRLGYLEQAVTDYERAILNGERRIFVFEQLIGLLDQLHRPNDIERWLAHLEAGGALSQRLTELAGVQELRRERPAQAIDLAQRNVDQHPNDPSAHLWLGRLLMIGDRPDEAERAIQTATQLAPADTRAWGALVSLYARTKNRDRLQSTLLLLEKNTLLDPSQSQLLAGKIHQLLGNFDLAKRNYSFAGAKADNDAETQLRVAQFYMDIDQEQAAAHLNTALRINPESVPAKRMLAVVKAVQGDMASAEALLGSIAGGGAAGVEDVRLNVLLLLRQGGGPNLERAAAMMEELVSRKSARGSMDRLLLSRLYEDQARIANDAATAQAKLQLAEQQLRALAQNSNSEPSALAALAQFFGRRGQPAEAAAWLAKLETCVDAMTGNAQAIATVIQLQIEQRLADRSEKWLSKLERIEGSTLRPVILRARVAASLNPDADLVALVEPKAESLFAESKTVEHRQQICSSVGDLYSYLKRDVPAERWYRKLLAEDPLQYRKLVAVLSKQGRWEEVRDLCQQAAAIDKSAQPAIVLGQALVERNAPTDELQRAEALLDRAVEQYGSNIDVLYTAALVRIVQDRYEESIQFFRAILAKNPHFVPALNNLAVLLAENPEDRQEALRLVNVAIQIQGNNSQLLDTKGTILLYSGRAQEAVPLLETATRNSETDPRYHLHLAIAYHQQGAIEQAKTQLATALEGQLASQVLSATDRKLLSSLRSSLKL